MANLPTINALAGGSVYNTPAVLTLTAQAAATVNGADQVNLTSAGIKLVVDITAITGGAPTTTIKVQGKDPVSGKYYDLLTSTALAAVATTVLTIRPAATAAANLTVNDALPASWRVIATVAGAGAVTATVAGSLLA